MRKITLITALFMSAVSISQIASTSFEEPVIFSGKYTDTGDPNLAHSLLNNPNEPIVNHSKNGVELGFQASYAPYDTPGVGSTDSDYVGVTKTKPSSTVFYSDGTNGYRMNDTDGNYILEFDPVDLSNVSSPSVSLDFLLSINSDATKGNYEGDGSINEAGHDRLRIYARDLTNNIEIDLFNSTGSNLDEFVPFDSATGKYQLEWQNAMADLTTNTNVQLVIEGRNNATAESFWFDNVQFLGTMGIGDLFPGQFKIYPNPATAGYVNIISKKEGIKNVSIYNIIGTQVYHARLTGERLNISELNSGVYILKIEQGKSSTTTKLVIN